MIDVQTELECLPDGAAELIRRAAEASLLRGGASGDKPDPALGYL